VTMLDRMRRHKGWLKWSLGIVVVMFVLLYIPSFLRPPDTVAANDAIATIGGRKVLVSSFQRAYVQQAQAMRSAYGDAFNEQMLQQFGLGQRILEQLINDEAVLIEAERLGLRVSDAELRQRIMTFPAFQQDGQFIGSERYRQLLASQRPPILPDQFEADIRRQILGEKLQALVTGWVHVDDAEVEREYRRRNEKVKLELAVFTAEGFKKTIQPTDAELKAQFDKDPEAYRLPEKRRVRFLSLDAAALKARQTATQQEIEDLYRRNQSMYSTPEQVRASHILFKTEGKDEAAVRKQAESVLAQVKKGGDFAALAKQHSEDEASKATGGDMDYFGRGAMVKEFDEAVWNLQPGQITQELVKTQYGFHIIKVADKRAAMTRSVADVRPQLEDQIKTEKAQAEASRKADELAAKIKAPADLDRVAREESLAVGDSGLFARDEPLAGLGFAPAVAAKAFELEPNKVSEQLSTGQGFAWIVVTEVKPAALPTLDQVRDKVRDDVIRTKAVEVARQRAETMAKAARGNFAAAAKAAGVEVKTTELITRGSPLPEVGTNQAVEDVIFALKPGDTSAPIPTDNAVVVARLVERQDVKPEDMATGKASVADDLRQQRQNQFFGAYMTKAREKIGQPTFNERAYMQVTGGR
jgi:peptidyl-prolyl cis-trans isomerase D